MLPKFDRKDARFFVGNPNISLISGRLSFAEDGNQNRGLRFLALLSIPDYMELRDVLDKFKYEIPKITTMRVLKTEFSKHYGLALEFASPEDAQEFYEMYQNKNFNLIEDSPIVLRWITKVSLDLMLPSKEVRSQCTNLSAECGLQQTGPTEAQECGERTGLEAKECETMSESTFDMVSVERPTEYIFSISDNFQRIDEGNEMEMVPREEHEALSVRDCPICLEPLLSNSCIMVLCSHKFHVHCLQGVQDHTCPVCRYQQYPFQVTFCDRCSQHEGLWCCVICGFIGCGGPLPVQGHSNEHAQETSHIYAKPLLKEVNSRVRGIWDHSKAGFIHNLVYRSQEGGQVVMIEQESNTSSGKSGGMDNTGPNEPADLTPKGKGSGKKFSEVQDQINQLISEQLSSAKDLFEGELRRIENEQRMLEAEHRDLKKICEREIQELLADKAGLEAQYSELRGDSQRLSEEANKLEAMRAQIVSSNNSLRKDKKALESKIEERREEKRARLLKIKADVTAKIEEIKDIKVHLENQKKFEGKVQPGSSILILGSNSAGSKNSSGSGSQKKR